MSQLLTELNALREETISYHYNASLAEIKEKVKHSPLEKNFTITTGCVSKEICTEIAHRLNNQGLKATVMEHGSFMTASYRMNIEIPLPDTLLIRSPDTAH